jgi:hypothetical protein
MVVYESIPAGRRTIMEGYRQIGKGSLRCDKECVNSNDNYQLDEEIRGAVHSTIIGETMHSGCEDFYVIVYKKLRQQAGEKG